MTRAQLRHHALAFSEIAIPLCIITGIVAIILIAGGCTGKGMSVYNPETGKKVFEYFNNSNSAIGGIQVEGNFKTGQFKGTVKSSEQDAAASNEAAFAAIQSAIDKIPAVK